MVEINSLAGTSFETLFETRNEAFGDYVRTWTKTEFAKMLHRRGYDPSLSFGAFDGQKLVSFTLNGIGSWEGIRTAYDTSTGTIKEYRGKGLATNIVNHALPFLKAAGIKQYLLEVLQSNTKAVSVYTKIGFRITREFNYFVQNRDEIPLDAKQLPLKYEIRETGLSRKDEMIPMWDFVPSWQNNFDAILRQPEDFKAIGVFEGSYLAGYGIIEPASGDIPQLAVGKQYRRQEIAYAIIRELLKHNGHSSIKIINAESANEAFTAFLENTGISKSGTQFEMIKEI